MSELKSNLIPYDGKVNSNRLKETAIKDLGETEELKEECLQQLRDLIQDHKVTCLSTDEFLLRFLRTKKFNTQRSFESLKNYVYQRGLFHKSLLKLTPEVLEACIRQNIVGLLPYRDSEERIVVMFRFGYWTPDICSVDDLITVYFLLGHYGTEHETSQITGLAYLFDIESMPVTHFAYIMSFANRWRTFTFNCVPARYTSIHIITKSLLLQTLRVLILPLVPKKIAERIVFHKEVGETLFEYYPPSTLPDVLGGTFGQLNSDYLIEKMKDYLQKLKDEYHHFQDDSQQ